MDATYQAKEKLLNQFGESIRSYFPTDRIEHEAIWISAVFDNLRASVAGGSPDAIDIAIFLIEKDPMWLPFGKLIKSDLARALKKNVAKISPAHREKIVAVVVRLLQSEHIPRELEDYAKLIKKFPPSEFGELVASVKPLCDKAREIQSYLIYSPC